MSLQLATKPKAQSIIIQEDSRHDLIIIGGGPAGLAAAIYAGREKLKTLIIEKMLLGGQAASISLIENYPGFPEGISGTEFMKKLSDQVKKLSPEIVWGSALELKKRKTGYEVGVDGRTFTARAIIIASGTETSKLGVPGEAEFRGRGVSYCAVCDGPLYQGKNVIVIGGGNSAIEEALFLTRFANKVSIVHRRDELRADRLVAERARNHPKIYFFWHSTLEEIKGEKNVTAVVVKDLLSSKKLTVPADGIFIYVGSQPNSAFVKDLVKLDAKGYIITDEKMATSAEGIFAAGDVRAKSLRQVVTAAADGALAAESAREFIER